MRQGVVRHWLRDAKAAAGWYSRENGERRGETQEVWSPVKGARQEVGGRVEPAHAICDGAYACDGLVLLLGWTLLLRQVVWDVRVLLYQNHRVLLERYNQLHKGRGEIFIKKTKQQK